MIGFEERKPGRSGPGKPVLPSFLRALLPEPQPQPILNRPREVVRHATNFYK